ncbi:MAG: endonuclease/exonuclease/phosphatase family protein [Pyrinomonadaceae bacterium]
MPVSPGASQGQLILSKHPFESTGGKYLSYQRSVAQATISVNNRMINIFATHLAVESASWRWTEANELVSFAVGFSGDHIIVGDFNAGYTTPEMKFLTASFRDTWEEAVNGKTAVAYSDNRVCMDTRTRRSRIDYVLYSRNSPNLMLKSAQVPDTRDLSNKNVKLTLGTLDDNGVRPSDHNQTIATFEIK